ncbi:MAG: hypothetical protein O3A00_08000 [Planctomycetota bacterium]|nr:hypothetical protein [Planctomycetota bacterium]
MPLPHYRRPHFEQKTIVRLRVPSYEPDDRSINPAGRDGVIPR